MFFFLVIRYSNCALNGFLILEIPVQQLAPPVVKRLCFLGWLMGGAELEPIRTRRLNISEFSVVFLDWISLR